MSAPQTQKQMFDEYVDAGEAARSEMYITLAGELLSLRRRVAQLEGVAWEAKEALQGAVDYAYGISPKGTADYDTAGWRGTIETIDTALAQGREG